MSNNTTPRNFESHKDAEGFSAAGKPYEESRPNYPNETIEFLITQLNFHKTSNILDLGAGTGKLSRQFARRSHKVISVDNSIEMLSASGGCEPNVCRVAARVERLPLRDNSMNGAVAGQSFHWFNAALTLGEIYRVLKPRSGLGLIWNRRNEESGWVQHMESLVRPYRRDAPLWHEIDWAEVIASHCGFSRLQKQDFLWERFLTPEAVAATVSSRSYVAALSLSQKKRLLEKVKDMATSYQEEGGMLRLAFTTHAYWCFKSSH